LAKECSAILNSIVTELLNAIEGERAHVVGFGEGYEVQKVLDEILKG
jgi:hypothetical protein